MNADVLTDMPLSDMIEDHLINKPLATLATTNRKTSRYFFQRRQPVIRLDQCGKKGDTKISRPAAHYEKKAFSGIHIISNRLFPTLQQDGKFSIVDAYLTLSATKNIRSFDHSKSHFIDVGKPENIVKAEAIFK